MSDYPPLRILYVEDDPSDADLARLNLARSAPQHTLAVVPSLAAARTRLATPGDFDIVLADLNLPDGSGLELLGHIRAHDLPLAVVILTGSGDHDSAVAALKAGADDYLVKHAGYLERLPQTLARALARHGGESARKARPFKVLYVEHDRFDIDLTRRHLAQQAPQIRLEVMASAAEALAALPARAGAASPWDVLLLDYRLPGLDALDLIKILRDERGLDLPVVLVTGHGSEEVAAQALRLGISDYLVKHPGYLYELPATLEKVLRQAELAREQAALRASEERIRLLLESTAQSIYGVDLDGRCTFVNPACLRTLGYADAQELLGQHMHRLIHHSHGDGTPYPEAQCQLHRNAREDQETHCDDEVFWRRDGSPIPVECWSRPIRHDGQVIGAVASFFDISERRQAEARTRLQSAALEAAANAIVITDSDAVIQWANPAFSTLTGYPLPEAVGRKPKDLVKSGMQSPEFYQALWRTILDGQVWRGEVVNRRKDGSLYCEDLTITPVREENGVIRHFVAVKQNITERKQAQSLQLARNEVLDQIIANRPLPAMLDEIARRLEAIRPGMLVSVLLMERSGGRLAYGAGPSLPDFYQAAVDGLEPVVGAGSCGTAAALGETVIAEDLQVHPDWAPYREIAARAGLGACWSVPFKDDAGQVLGVFSIYHHAPRAPSRADLDLIGEFARLTGLAVRKAQVEAERQALEQRFRATFEQAAVGIAHVAPDGHFIRVNQRLCDIIGYGREELMRLSFQAITHPDDLARDLDLVRQTLAGEIPSYVMEKRYVRKQGSSVWINLTVTLVRTATGEPDYFISVIEDISERKRAEEALRQAATVFDSTREGVIITDLEPRILAVNPAFAEITGYSQTEVLGRNPSLLKSERHDQSFFQAMWSSIGETGYWQGEIWNRRKDGDIYPQLLTISTVRNGHGEASQYVGVLTDISQLKQSEERLQHLAHYDPLTELPNRLLVLSRLEHTLEGAERHGHRVGVLFIDLDRFKNVNDSLGHPVGDELLAAIARRLRARLRDEDTLARLGGDEFLVVLEELQRPEDAAGVAQTLLQLLEQPFRLASGHEVYVGASIGISLHPDDGASVTELIQHADVAMYLAKEQGRNTYRFYTKALTQAADERFALETKLRHALSHDQFVVHYQPQIDIGNGAIIGCEALVRWLDPVAGLTSPARFIPLAEETGLIVPLGEWVLRTACSQARRWLDAGLPPVTMAVNLSGRQLQQRDLVQRVRAILAETGLPPAFLKLELTESMIMGQEEQAEGLLHALKAIGVKLAIDDFGTGYSSLAYLKRFPIDELKIDQSFVRDIPQDLNDMEIAATIIAMARNLNLEVMAEGVETAEQLSFLTRQRCHAYQGYLFSRPVAEPEVERLLRGVEAGQRPPS